MRRQILRRVDAGREKTIELLQLLAANCRLDFRHPVIVTDHVDEISHSLPLHDHLAVIADELQSLRETIIIRHDNATFAGVNCLVIIQTEHANVRERSRKTSLVLCSRCLRRILDDGQRMSASEIHDWIHVDGLTENVDRHDRPGLRRDALLDRFCGDVERLGIDVGKNRNRAVHQRR